MVYRGKPALGCAWCRKRRLACDRKTPCSQCVRADKQCGGYHDPNTLRIYDQTKEVTVKAQSRSVVVRGSKSTISDTPIPLKFVYEPISIDERATSHIFTYYVGKIGGRGLLSFLPELLGTDQTGTLQAAVKAIGLSSMSRIHNLPDLRRLASEEYSTALMSLNKALQSPTTAKSDSTLGTVAMLSMYEIVACHDMASGPGFDIMDRWLNHVKGGMRLLELRGVDQLNTTAGVELFTTVRLQTAISGVFFRHNGYNTPSIAAISQVARTRRDAITQPIEDFYNTLIQFNDLAGEVNEDCSNFTVENIGSYIGRALRLDADLRSWAMSLGPDWSFTTVTEPNFNRSDDTQFPMNGGKYHIYNNVNLASMWNHYRQTRIVLHEMIRVLALYLSKLRETSECQHTILASAAISNQMVDDVCSSVRYHFMSDEARFGGAVRLLWPLFLAAGVRDLNPEIKEWIIKILSLISKAMGIQQAAVMSQLLREGRLTNLIPGT